LALTSDGSRLFVSSAGANFISVFDVAADLGTILGGRRVVLSGQMAQTRRLNASPPTRALGQFIYAVASDRSVRVISVDLEQECETNLDLAQIKESSVPVATGRCYLVGGGSTPARRVTEKGPGLRFGNLLPTDVQFIQVSKNEATDAGVTTTDAGPTASPLSGTFALIAVSDGNIYVVDLEDDNFVPEGALMLDRSHLPHRVRNALQGTSSGKTDAGIVSVTGAASGGIPVVISKEDGVALPGEGVGLRGEGESVSSEWTLAYEPTLKERSTGQLYLGTSELRLVDPGADFCRAGARSHLLDSQQRLVDQGDIVVVVGCGSSDDCALNEVCRKPVAKATAYGLCLDRSRENTLFKQCTDLLQSDREYLVKRALDGHLVIDVLPVEPQGVLKQAPQPASPCSANSDCANGYLCALDDRPVPDSPERSLTKGECFRLGCETDADCSAVTCQAPLDGGPKFCAPAPAPLELSSLACTKDDDCRPSVSGLGQACKSDKDCDAQAECRQPGGAGPEQQCVDRGMVCSSFVGTAKVCLRPSPCFGQLVRYQLKAGRTFVVGSYGRRVADAKTKVCRDDESQSELFNNRVPLGLPTYPVLVGPTCDPAKSQRSLPSPNPCFERTTQGYSGYEDKSGATGDEVTQAGPTTVVRFANPDIYFSVGLGHLTKVPASATTPGSSVIEKVLSAPMPARDLNLRLSVNSGYGRMVGANTGTSLSFPVRIIEGPDGLVYVVDAGDIAGTTGTNGQLLRLLRLTMTLDPFAVK
jgi:hypothetical protein